VKLKGRHATEGHSTGNRKFNRQRWQRRKNPPRGSQVSCLQVLLVEPHQSVRHCMLLYLRGNGAHVKAVCSEDQAISCLRLQGAPPPLPLSLF
jgi:hypothetical protein